MFCYPRLLFLLEVVRIAVLLLTAGNQSRGPLAVVGRGDHSGRARWKRGEQSRNVNETKCWTEKMSLERASSRRLQVFTIQISLSVEESFQQLRPSALYQNIASRNSATQASKFFIPANTITDWSGGQPRCVAGSAASRLSWKLRGKGMGIV